MVKPKTPEIGVWKTIESKSCHKHEKDKLKPNKKPPAKSSKQKDIKHFSRARSFNKTPRHQVHRNQQWNNFPTSMSFSSCRSPMSMPWSTYFSIPYSCHHDFIIYICRPFLHICVQITLLIGSWQSMSHHLQTMTILIIEIGQCRKVSVR